MEKRKRISILAGVAIILNLTLSVVALAHTCSEKHLAGNEFPARSNQIMSVSGGVETDFTIAAEKAVNAVVHIKSTVMRQVYGGSSFGDPFLDFFFGDRGRHYSPQPQVGMGSGVIISNDGYIVTNNHVIESADDIEVTLNDKRSFKAKLIGVDPVTDIALLKIDASNLPTISFGDSDKLRIGEWVLAVGNPFNLTSTVTAGIVSAKARNINILSGAGGMKIESFIQTDAAVNPGNSGGALVNTSGELVGINTAIASQTGNYTGYSFAVPVSIVSKVVSDLKEYGVVQRAVLGINIMDINSQLAKEKDLDILEGIYVENVLEKGGAKEAGIRQGDVIIGINGTKVKSVSELLEQVSRYRPGDKISIKVERGKEIKDFNLTLKNKQGNTDITKEEGIEILGAKFKEVGSDLKKQLGINYGLQVTEISQGRFQSAGIRKGFIILKINDQPVRSQEEIEAITRKLLNSEEKAMFIIGAYPNGKVAYYAVNLSEDGGL